MTFKYPRVLNEDETLGRALEGYSLARYGDGELRICLGGNCISQYHHKRLAAELIAILKEPEDSNLIPCIPNARTTVKDAWRTTYAGQRFVSLYTRKTYGSAFITRPDSAPWIDRPDYWAKVQRLWVDRDVTLVLGTERSLHKGNLPGARSIREVWGPRRDAYTVLSAIEEQVGEPSGPILLCLGPAATVLAARLARKGLWAIDLGHIGMFMRSRGTHMPLDQLISPAYRKLQQELHSRPTGYGGSGRKQADAVLKFARRLKVDRLLDYGCGEGTLKRALKDQGLTIFEYDPAIKGKDQLPKPAELVICTDVLEHIEPERLDAVLDHIYRLTERAAYFLIATRPANKIMANGRNAHLIIEDATWWWKRLQSVGFVVQNADIAPGHAVKFWCVK